MILKDYSSRVRTRGSDRDIVLWCNRPTWKAVEKLVKDIENKQVYVPVKLFNTTIDLFLAPVEVPGTYTMAAMVSHAMQQAWDEATVSAYAQAKAKVSHLNGRERKQAKAQLAREFGLPTVQYNFATA